MHIPPDVEIWKKQLDSKLQNKKTDLDKLTCLNNIWYQMISRKTIQNGTHFQISAPDPFFEFHVQALMKRYKSVMDTINRKSLNETRAKTMLENYYFMLRIKASYEQGGKGDQHILPKFYIRSFALGDRFYQIDFKNQTYNEVNERQVFVSRKQIYDPEVEDFWNKLETPMADFIRNIRQRIQVKKASKVGVIPISGSERVILSLFVASLIVRSITETQITNLLKQNPKAVDVDAVGFRLMQTANVIYRSRFLFVESKDIPFGLTPIEPVMQYFHNREWNLGVVPLTPEIGLFIDVENKSQLESIKTFSTNLHPYELTLEMWQSLRKQYQSKDIAITHTGENPESYYAYLAGRLIKYAVSDPFIHLANLKTPPQLSTLIASPKSIDRYLTSTTISRNTDFPFSQYPVTTYSTISHFALINPQLPSKSAGGQVVYAYTQQELQSRIADLEDQLGI